MVRLRPTFFIKLAKRSHISLWLLIEYSPLGQCKALNSTKCDPQAHVDGTFLKSHPCGYIGHRGFPIL